MTAKASDLLSIIHYLLSTNMKHLSHFFIAGLILLFQSACAKTSDREYINHDPQACAKVAVNCKQDQHPFYDDKGCGCLPNVATTDPKRYYVNPDTKACSTLLFKCQGGQSPFFDQQGCGCQINECDNADEKELPANPADYQKVEIKDASVSFEIPKTWIKQGNNNVWTPPEAKGSPFISFKWENFQSQSSDWEPTHILPKPASLLGPYNISLGWEQGLLYFVQIHDAEKKVNKFEIHTIIPRMEAGIAYDFYASADTLEQLKGIDSVHQHFIQSGELSSIKNYISKDGEECQNQEINCEVGEQEFYDDTGCGCETKPVEDAVYDN